MTCSVHCEDDLVTNQYVVYIRRINGMGIVFAYISTYIHTIEWVQNVNVFV